MPISRSLEEGGGTGRKGGKEDRDTGICVLCAVVRGTGLAVLIDDVWLVGWSEVQDSIDLPVTVTVRQIDAHSSIYLFIHSFVHSFI